MDTKPKLTFKKAFIVVTALIAWFALILQSSLSIPTYLNTGRTLPGAITQLLSYFTILSNILIAFSLSAIALKPDSLSGRYFLRSSVNTALAVYITIVGLTYNLILRKAVALEGFWRLADELLHVAIPLLFIIYWIFFAPKAALKWRDLYLGLIFPLVYLVCILIRGAISGYYPYPFMDVNKLGYPTVALHSAGMLLAFVLVSVLFISIGRYQYKKGLTANNSSFKL